MPTAKILIVDDDHDIQQGVTLRLRSAGYETLTADDGAEGVAAAMSQNPDAILLDVRMPNVNGLTALESLAGDDRTTRTPIIMLSASLRDQQTALDKGARYFLKKPFRSDDLLTAIGSVLKR